MQKEKRPPGEAGGRSDDRLQKGIGVPSVDPIAAAAQAETEHLRIAILTQRHGLPPARAELVAGLAWQVRP